MRLFCAGIVLLVLGPVLAGAPVRLVGSDFLDEIFVIAVKSLAKEQGIELTVEMEGSLPGRQSLEEGNADIALLSLSPNEAPFSPEYFSEPVAFYITAVLVPAQLVLEQISYRQLANVFSDAGNGGQMRWSEMGVSGERASRSVVPVVMNEGSGLCWSLFRYEVLRNTGDFDAPVVEESENAVDGDVIALASLPPEEGSTFRALPVARVDGGAAYEPSEANVYRGDYPLRWPLYVVFPKSEVVRLYPVLRFLLGDEAAEHYRRVQIMPVPAEVRKEHIFGLEQL